MIEFVTNRKVLLGENTLKEIPSVLRWYGKTKVFLAVYSAAAPCVAAVRAGLEENNIPYVLFDKIVSEPDLAVIDAGAALCAGEHCDAVVAIGGGSVLDAAKAIGMLAVNGGTTAQYQLEGKAVAAPPLLLIAVPTTAGTGSEATKVSVIYNAEKGFKKSIYHNSMIAEVVVLDPTTTVGLPPKVTAATGMDAITHAIESYTSLNADVFSRMYSLKALALLYENLETAYREPENLVARQNMLLGSYFAGCAIAAGTCLAHIVGQPVGAIYKIPHGDSCSIFLIPSMRLNKNYALKQYVDVAKTLGVSPEGKSDDEMFEEGAARLEALCQKINAPARLTQYLPAEKLDVEYVLDNIETSMGHIKHNPRPVSRALFKELLLAAL